ncbi:MAG: U32 family peptidase [Clostridia bacterium]|nr:U32 family peptidase [Clostridia bacterium]
MNYQTKPELLAPAGDLECLQAALRFGADAVYVGGPMMQLRASSAGMTLEDVAKGVALCHAVGKKLYVTVNCFAKDETLERLPAYSQTLYQLGVDGVIVSDLGAVSVLRTAVPGLPVHISTQANCQNAAAAMVYYAMGVRRVVVARETSLEEIRKMKSLLPPDMEIEAFVHGAMCMAYSGRCFISSMLTGRSGNQGECTQPCRWGYHLTEQKRPGEFFPVEEHENGTNILSSRDLCCLSLIDELKEAGVASFKIEGRMKTPYYVATVVRAYRNKIDGTAPDEELLKELEAVSHRPYSTGFYKGAMFRYKPDDHLPYVTTCSFAGTVLKKEEGRVLIEQRSKFSVGDTLEGVSPKQFGISFVVESITDQEGNPQESANHAMQKVWVNCNEPLEPGDLVRTRLHEKE